GRPRCFSAVVSAANCLTRERCLVVGAGPIRPSSIHWPEISASKNFAVLSQFKRTSGHLWSIRSSSAGDRCALVCRLGSCDQREQLRLVSVAPGATSVVFV